jgi:Rab GDP dissociation inhibitor
MDEEYDVVVLGTGLVECILSSLLSMEGKKVLHIDRNDYYGGDCASLNLTQLYKKFRPGFTTPDSLGRDRDYNVDLVPKFLMASGELARILAYTDVTRYLEFRQVAGSYVYRDGKIYKVPSTEMEALTSSLFGLWEKKKAMNFFHFMQAYRQDDPKTHQGGLDLKKVTMAQVYKYFDLNQGIQDFVGHAMALHLDDTYSTEQTAWESYENIVLYMQSMNRFGKSPYIYPMYGLGELPQGFARLSAIYGGTYMLDKPFDGLVMSDTEQGVVAGVRSGSEVARCKAVIGDPSYFPDRVRAIGKVIRAICILKSPIPNTSQADSTQIIIPQRQIGRKYDIYIACVSHSHNICPDGHYIAFVSTIMESQAQGMSNPEREILPALSLLGPIVEKFIMVSDLTVPIDDGTQSKIYLSRSYDASSHFETVYQDVMDIYKRVTGKDLVVQKRLTQEEEERLQHQEQK